MLSPGHNLLSIMSISPNLPGDHSAIACPESLGPLAILSVDFHCGRNAPNVFLNVCLKYPKILDLIQFGICQDIHRVLLSLRLLRSSLTDHNCRVRGRMVLYERSLRLAYILKTTCLKSSHTFDNQQGAPDLKYENRKTL